MQKKQKYVRPVAYFRKAAIVVVDLTGGVGIRQVPRREVEQCEVDALSRLGDDLDGTRRHGLSQRAQTVSGRGGSCIAMRQNCHSATIADGPVVMTLWLITADVTQFGGYRLLPVIQTLIVIR